MRFHMYGIGTLAVLAMLFTGAPAQAQAYYGDENQYLDTDTYDFDAEDEGLYGDRGVYNEAYDTDLMDEEISDIEWQPGEGYHEEEWYDPSDWFDGDAGVEYEDYGDYGYDAGVGYDYGYDYDYGYGYDAGVGYDYYDYGYDWYADDWDEGWYGDSDAWWE